MSKELLIFFDDEKQSNYIFVSRFGMKNCNYLKPLTRSLRIQKANPFGIQTKSRITNLERNMGRTNIIIANFTAALSNI